MEVPKPIDRLTAFCQVSTIVMCAILLSGCDREPPADQAVPQPPVSEQVQAEPYLPEGAEPPATEWNYRLVRAFDSGMEELRAIRVTSDGKLYAAGEGGIRVFDLTGEVLTEIQTTAPAQAVALDADGNLWVGLRTKVEKYAPDGRLLTSWGTEGRGRGELSFVTGIDVHGMNVLVADSGNRVVHRFDLTGDFVNEIGERDSEAGFVGIILPSPTLECHVDEEGRVQVNNSGRLRVETYRLDGELMGHWGEAGIAAEKFCGCCNPSSISLGEDGRVATGEKAIHRVKVYDAEHRMIAHVGPKHFSSDQTTPLLVGFAPEERLIVGDTGDKRIRVFERAEVE